ncbi:MAG: hypothetical protein ACRDRO_28590 [Pseudonocardiaceae bacterium]
MDKVVSELLSPFTRSLAPGSLVAAAFFWGTGLLLFHQFPPQALQGLGCPTGGVDLCGLLARNHGDPNFTTIAGVLVFLVLFITAQNVFARAAEITQFLCGTGWSQRRLFVFFQHHFRERLIKRGYGPRGLPSGSVHVRPISNRCRQRANRYPHGAPRKPHDDLPRLVDMPLEPTFLGNVFAAMHQHILATHGLRLASCWELLLRCCPPTR